MRDFRDLEVWKKGVDLVKEVYNIIAYYPSSERFGLCSQIARCAISIPSNIAEGSARESQKEFSRFLQIALGSSFELETQLVISKELGFLNLKEFDAFMPKLNRLQKSIHALRKYTDSKT